MSKTSRMFTLVSYLSKDEIDFVIKAHASLISHYAYILHDKDKTDNHFHILLKTYNSRMPNAVCKWFKIGDQNTFIEVPYDESVCVSYLTHSDIKSLADPNKADYKQEDIISDDLSFWLGIANGGDLGDKGTDIIDDLVAGKPLHLMYKKYGREFIINYKKYVDFANLLNARSEVSSLPHMQVSNNLVIDRDGEVALELQEIADDSDPFLLSPTVKTATDSTSSIDTKNDDKLTSE